MKDKHIKIRLDYLDSLYYTVDINVDDITALEECDCDECQEK